MLQSSVVHGPSRRHCHKVALAVGPPPRAPHTPRAKTQRPSPFRGLFRLLCFLCYFLQFIVLVLVVFSYTILLSGDDVGISMLSSLVVFVVLAPPAPRMFLGHVSRVGLTLLQAPFIR